jgi:hypothetical protein
VAPFVDHPSIHGCRSPSTRNVPNVFHPSIYIFIQIIIHPPIHPCILSLPWPLSSVVQVDQKTTSQTHLVSGERSRPLISTALSASPPSDEECWLARSFKWLWPTVGRHQSVISSCLFLSFYVGFFISLLPTKRGRQVCSGWLPWTLNCPSRRSSPFSRWWKGVQWHLQATF